MKVHKFLSYIFFLILSLYTSKGNNIDINPTKIDVIVEEFHPDIILLGPQVKFKFEETASKYEPKGIPVAVIDLEDYGKIDGERILKRAIKILKEKAVKEDVW